MPQHIIPHCSISPAGQQPDPVPGLVQLVRLAAAGLAHPQHQQPHHLVRRPGGRAAQVFTFEQSSFPHKKYFSSRLQSLRLEHNQLSCDCRLSWVLDHETLAPLARCLVVTLFLRINSHEESVVVMALLGPLQLILDGKLSNRLEY